MLSLRVLLLFVGLPLCAYAQKYLALQYGTGEGLPSAQVRDVITGEQGFLWVATDGGLLRFDGENFTSYNRALDSYYIKALAKDTSGHVLFLNDNGLYQLDHRTPAGDFRPDTAFLKLLVPAAPLPTDTALYYPNHLFVDRHNQCWISQPDGRVALVENGALEFFKLCPPFEVGGSQAGFTFAESPDGTLVAGSTTGELFRYDPVAGQFQRLPVPNRLKQIHCLYWQGAALLIGGNGLFRTAFTNGRPGKWEADPLEGREVASLAPGGSDSRILIGTKEDGLFQATRLQNQWALKVIYGANDPHRINTLPFESIHRIHRDTDDNIWLGTAQGLGLLQSRFFETVFGLANNNTLSTLPLPNAEVLISYGDVFAINAREGAFFAAPLPQLDRGLITALAYTQEQLFLGTTAGALLSYQHGQLKNEASLEDRGGGIFFMESSSDGSVWICQAPDDNPIVGIARRLPNGQLLDYGAEAGLESRILVVRESPRQRLYAAGIGPGSYLYRYLPEGNQFINLSLPLPFPHSAAFEVHDMAVDERGIIWLATTDGLLRFDLEHIQRVQLGPHTTTEVRAVAALQDGRLWLSTSTEGLLYYDERRQSYTLFDQDSGLPSTVGAYRCLSRSQDDRIWVGTAEGTVYSRDLEPQPMPTQPPVLLHIGTAQESWSPNTKAIIELRPKDQLELAWASPTFPAERLAYRYRLQGTADSNWVALGFGNQLTLSVLPAGASTLELQGRKPGGHIWSTPLRVPLNVRPPWHERWWANLLWIALGSLALYVFFKQVVARLVRYILILKKKVRLRDQTIRAQRNQLAEQSAGLAQQESDLQAISAQQAQDNARSLPLLFLHHSTNHSLPHPDWTALLQQIQYAVDYHSACDNWEIGWYASELLHSLRFVSGQDRPQSQSVPFDEKSELLAWLLVHGTPLLMNHFSQEHQAMISLEQLLAYESVLGVKGEIPGKQPFAIVFGAHRKEAFSQGDLKTLELLTRYIALAIQQPLDTKLLRL